jgi:hypothetical protein
VGDDIKAFFDAFAASSDACDLDKLLPMFADSFLAADMNGAHAVPANALRIALPKRKQMFSELGLKSTALVSLQQTPLDDQYVMVKTRWRWNFEGVEPLENSSTFIVRRSEGTPKIVFYLTHEDMMAMLRAKKSSPAAP